MGNDGHQGIGGPQETNNEDRNSLGITILLEIHTHIREYTEGFRQQVRT